MKAQGTLPRSPTSLDLYPCFGKIFQTCIDRPGRDAGYRERHKLSSRSQTHGHRRRYVAREPGSRANLPLYCITRLDKHLQALQSLSAHVKLLLDAPEHLWRLMERKSYLNAAWLFLLARVVHRALSQEDDDQSWQAYGIDVMVRVVLSLISGCQHTHLSPRSKCRSYNGNGTR